MPEPAEPAAAGAAARLRPEDLRRRRQFLAGWPAGVVSYRLGARFVCEVDNVDPGAVIARGEGATREQAEAAAIAAAERRLGRTRILGGGKG